MTETKTKPVVKKAAASEAKAAVKKSTVSATKPVVKKATASEMATKKAAPKAPAKKAESLDSNQQRYEMIQNAAYYIAEHNGFVGDPHAFWAEAEAQINNIKS